MELLTTHINADFDALAAMVAASRLHPGAKMFFPGSREESVRRMLESGFFELAELKRAGRFMGRFVLEDLSGSLPVTLFANQLQQFGHLLAEDALVLVRGQVRERGGDFELTVEEIRPLDKLGVRPWKGSIWCCATPSPPATCCGSGTCWSSTPAKCPSPST